MQFSGRVKERIDNATSTSCNSSSAGANPSDEALQPFADSGKAFLGTSGWRLGCGSFRRFAFWMVLHLLFKLFKLLFSE